MKYIFCFLVMVVFVLPTNAFSANCLDLSGSYRVVESDGDHAGLNLPTNRNDWPDDGTPYYVENGTVLDIVQDGCDSVSLGFTFALNDPNDPANTLPPRYGTLEYTAAGVFAQLKTHRSSMDLLQYVVANNFGRVKKVYNYSFSTDDPSILVVKYSANKITTLPPSYHSYEKVTWILERVR